MEAATVVGYNNIPVVHWSVYNPYVVHLAIISLAPKHGKILFKGI